METEEGRWGELERDRKGEGERERGARDYKKKKINTG